MSKQIPLTQGKFAIVDDDMFEYLNQWKWCVSESAKGVYYACRNVSADGKQTLLLMHKLVAEASKQSVVDHINKDLLDNRKNNLRICSRTQSNWHRKKGIKKSSRYKGVSLHKPTQKWRVRITLNYKQYYLGRYKDEIDAALAYDKAAKEMFGKFALLNF